VTKAERIRACGAIEAWLTIAMMKEGWFAPTLNLDRVDPPSHRATISGRRLGGWTSNT
jgi:3-oxoacyl-[acyl-carrier-protein] synthase II